MYPSHSQSKISIYFSRSISVCCEVQILLSPVRWHNPRLEINVGWSQPRLDYSHADFFISSNYSGKNLLVTPGQRGRPPRLFPAPPPSAATLTAISSTSRRLPGRRKKSDLKLESRWAGRYDWLSVKKWNLEIVHNLSDLTEESEGAGYWASGWLWTKTVQSVPVPVL